MLATFALPVGAAPLANAGVRMAPATPGGVRFTVSVPTPTFRRVDNEQQLDELAIQGYGGVGGEPGVPALPTRVIMVAVPPLGDVRLTAVGSETSVRDGLTLSGYPGVGPDGQPRPVARKLAAYGAAGSGTPEAARLLDVSWMRNQRVARVLISPAAYEPAARRLTVAGRVDVELAVTPLGTLGPAAEPSDPFESVYRLSLINYEQGRAWRRPRTDVLRAAAQRGGLPLQSIAALVPPPDTSLYVGRTWIKIAVQRTGFYSVNFSRLRSLSLFSATGRTPLDSLRLFSWPGRTVLPLDTYCDSCDYHEVAIGIVRDVTAARPDSSDGFFADNDDAFYFFAQGPDGWESDMDATRPDTNFITHQFEKNNFYYLTVATAASPVSGLKYPVPPRRIGVAPGTLRSVTPTGSETPQATVAGRLHMERDVEYWPDASALGSTLVWEKWFWQSLLGGGQSFRDTLSLPDADLSQPARFRMRDWGLSDNVLNFKVSCITDVPDHFLDVVFNDVVFPRRSWFGMTVAERAGITLDTTGLILRKFGNSVTASVPSVPFIAGCPNRIDRSGIAFYELYYERFLQPVRDAIDFRTHRTPGDFVYNIGPFVKLPSAYVFDITDPLRPVMLQGGIASGTPGAFTLVLADTQTVSHRYAVVPDSVIQSNSALLPPSALADAPFTSLDNLRSATKAADYLVIYYDGFKAAADSLAAWRSEHLPLIATPAPHVALTVPISAIYDQFSGGRTDPGAIRSFLRAAIGWSRRPLYVAFLGDASFDFKDISGRAIPGQPGCLLPTFENNFDNNFLIRRQYSTDDWLVNVNDPVVVLPDYLAGRIPAGDAGSALDVVVNKLLAYERAAPFGEYRGAAVLMADDDAQGNDDDPIGWGHLLQTDSLNVNHTPLEIDREYVYLHTFPSAPGATKPGARTQLVKDLDGGASVWNFVGHGSPFKMTDEGVFLDTDAGTLTNGLKMSLLVAASCDVGKFNDPSVQSLGERLFMLANGGCIGVVSATEQALSGNNSALNIFLYDALFNRDTLSVAGIPLPTTGQYHVPISAALLVAKSVPFSLSVNNQKFQLMGDPATQLNLPRLWADLTFTDATGQPVTQLARGQTVNFKGRVLDHPQGTPVPLEGVASVLIEDSAPTNIAPPGLHSPISYRFSAGPMYHGDVTLHAGAFTGRFVVPLDAAAGVDGRIRAYFSGDASGGPATTDGAGVLQATVVPGAPSGTDTEGPRITLSFVGGSTNVHPDATLQISLFDESGIMTTGHAPQNSIIITLDQNTTSRADVTGTFRYAADSYQSGTASFQLPNLSRGAHQVKVSAADNLATGITAVQHRSSATLDFQVVDTPPLSVAHTFLFPNPVRSGGKGSGGVVVVDAPGDSINTLIRFYTVAGKLVRTLRQFGGIGQIQVAWDGLDEEGDPLAQGTYLYKVYVSVRDADGKSSPRQKATAEGRFVVLNP